MSDDSLDLASEEQQRMKALLRLMDSAPVVVFQIDRDGLFVLSEGGALAGLGLRPGQVVGMNAFDLYKDVPDVVAAIRGALEGEEAQSTMDVGPRRFATIHVPLRPSGGEIAGVMGLAVDVTVQREAAEALRERERELEEHRRALQAVTTPILQVWDGVLCVPIIGNVDQHRATAMMDAILAEVGARNARHVILDLTGVEHIDTETAGGFIKILRAVVLLGARGVVAGIRPAVAQAMVHLGLELAIDTHATLQDALRSCMREGGAAPRRQRGA